MRQKVRLRAREKTSVYLAASNEAERNIYPVFKKFVNALPWHQRAFLAWRLIWGEF